MTKNDIKSALEAIIDNASPVSPIVDLTPIQLTTLTDALASGGLETVNPNGPCYPSTPR